MKNRSEDSQTDEQITYTYKLQTYPANLIP